MDDRTLEVVGEAKNLSTNYDYIDEDFYYKIAKNQIGEISADTNNNLAKFSVELFKTVAAAEDGNFVVSPNNVAMSLYSLYDFANGDTASEMGNYLVPLNTSINTTMGDFSNFNKVTEMSGCYNTYNSIWIKNNMADTMNASLINSIKNKYNTDIFASAFDASTSIDMNRWISKRSLNKVEEIIEGGRKISDPIVALDIACLTVSWKEQYPVDAIDKEYIFKSIKDEEKTVIGLNSVESYYIQYCGGQGIIKPYNDTLSFIGILPPEEMDIDEFIQQMSGTDLISSYKLKKEVNVKTTIPCFSCKNVLNLTETLQGKLKTAFSNEADLSNISDESHLTEVIHQTGFEINQYGSKANSVSYVKSTIDQEANITIEFNRPFVYFVIDTEMGMPIMIGVVKDIENSRLATEDEILNGIEIEESNEEKLEETSENSSGNIEENTDETESEDIEEISDSTETQTEQEMTVSE